MKRSCLITVITWVVLGVAYYLSLHGRFEPPADWIAALVGSFFTTLGTGALRNVGFLVRDRRLISRSSRTEMLRSPQRAAVCGRIVPQRDPLITPFTEKEAVLCSYEIYEEHVNNVRTSSGSRTERNKEIFYSGYQLCPSVIRASIGDVKLLGFPSLNGFGESFYEGPQIEGAARSFVSRTQWEDVKSGSVKQGIAQFRDLFTDDDGTINKNWRFHGEQSIEGLECQEEFVESGEEVCAIGHYVPQKGGIVNDLGKSGTAIELYRGDPKAVKKLIGGKIRGMCVAAFFFIVVVNAVIAFVLYRYDSAPTQIQARNERVWDAVDQDDLKKVREIVEFKVDLSTGNSASETPLMRAKSAAMAELLLAHGSAIDSRDMNGRTALMRAVQYGRGEVATALVRAGADVNVRDNWGDTALIFAVESGRPELEALLLEAGALDDRISAKNGRELSESSPEVKVCFEYLAAIHEGDLNLMRKRFVDAGRDPFEGVDLKIWQDSRPRHPRLVEGFSNDRAATILIGSHEESDSLPHWQYQLVREGSEWRISRERWR